MGFRFGSAANVTAFQVPPANSAEFVLCTFAPVCLPVDSCAVFFSWSASITVGASITALVFRIRRGVDTTGAVIGAAPWTNAAVAGKIVLLMGCYFDVFFAAHSPYVLTMSQTGATAASTILAVSVAAYVL